MSKHQCIALICNKRGLHARAAAKLATLANQHQCEVRIGLDAQELKNAKNIMEVMMLAASCGREVVLSTEGENAELALAQLVELIQNRFDEDA